MLNDSPNTNLLALDVNRWHMERALALDPMVKSILPQLIRENRRDLIYTRGWARGIGRPLIRGAADVGSIITQHLYDSGDITALGSLAVTQKSAFLQGYVARSKALKAEIVQLIELKEFGAIRFLCEKCRYGGVGLVEEDILEIEMLAEKKGLRKLPFTLPDVTEHLQSIFAPAQPNQPT